MANGMMWRQGDERRDGRIHLHHNEDALDRASHQPASCDCHWKEVACPHHAPLTSRPICQRDSRAASGTGLQSAKEEPGNSLSIPVNFIHMIYLTADIK